VGETASGVKSSDGNYIAWKEHIVDSEESGGKVLLRGAGRMVLLDLDKDGHDDIIAMHQESGHLRVAFGSQSPDDWFRLSLAEGAEVPSPEDLAAGDLNGDDFPDVVVATASHLLYLQNNGSPARGLRWERVSALSNQGLAPFRRVAVADWNRDGKLDVVAVHEGRGAEESNSGGAATVVSWFELPADHLEEKGWQRHELGVAEETGYARLVDLDGDGVLDVFAVPQDSAQLFWLRLPTDGSASMERHAIQPGGSAQASDTASRLDGSRAVFADLNGDKRLDVILPADPNSLVWLEQPPEPANPWTLHRIGSIAPDVLGGIAVADINGDGRDDVMVGGVMAGERGEPTQEQGEQNVNLSAPAGRIAWLEQPSDSSAEWERHDIARYKAARFEFLFPRDMDSDGVIDFLFARAGSDSKDGIYWLQQLRASYAVDVFEPVLEIEGDQLPLP
jgi:hypothetical protein